MYAINLDDNDRILRATIQQFADSESILVDSLPTGQTAKEQDITNWLYQGGQYVYSPKADPTPPPEPIDIDRLDAQMLFTAMMTDTLMQEVSE